jgi:hypothetical protein
MINKNNLQPVRQQLTISCMRIACVMPNATNTLLEFVIHASYFSAATVVARPRLNVTLHVHSLSCFD